MYHFSGNYFCLMIQKSVYKFTSGIPEVQQLSSKENPYMRLK